MLENSDDLDRRLSELVSGERPPGSARRAMFDNVNEYTQSEQDYKVDADLRYEEKLNEKYVEPPKPASIKDKIVEVSRKNLLALIAAGAIAVLFVVAQLDRSSAAQLPETEDRTTPVIVETPEPSPSRQPLVVHVIGAVNNPGVVEVPEGSRVVTAIEAAGGVTDDANLGELNLAMPISDGVQIFVSSGSDSSEVRTGKAAEGGTQAEGSAGKINLNTASQSELEQLPGVGPVTASAIVEWRTKNGKFSSPEQLQEIDGIGPKSFAKLSEKVCV